MTKILHSLDRQGEWRARQSKRGVVVSFKESSTQGQIGFAVNQTQLTTDAQGVVSANVVLGNKSGTYEISATCNDCEPKEIVFTANATPAALINYSGDKQIGVVGGVITNPLTVKASDQVTNEAVSNIGINFQITTNTPTGATGQKLEPVSMPTDNLGFARTVFTLGNKQGDYTIAANYPMPLHLLNLKPAANGCA